MISREYSCIFIHNRKCAGSSIIRSFGFSPADHEWHLYNDGTQSAEWVALSAKDKQHFLVFSVVRNPWDRFISGWRYLKRFRNLTLDEVLDNLPYEGHDYRHLVRPQVDILLDDRGKFAPNVLLRYESLRQDYYELCIKLGKPFLLPHINSTKRGDYRQYFSQSQAARVRNLFEEDIERFGYRF